MTTKITHVSVPAHLCVGPKKTKKKFFLTKVVIPMAFLISSAFVARANTLNDWNAGDGNWSTDANWSLGHVPTNTEDAEILNGATVTLDVDADLNKFFIGGGSTLNFDGTHSMNVSNDCTIGDGSGTNTVNLVSGSFLTVGNNIGGNGGGHLDVSGGGTVTCSGSFFPNNYDIGTPNNGAGKLILNGSGGFNPYDFQDLEIAGDYSQGGSNSVNSVVYGTFTVDAGKEFNPGGDSRSINGGGSGVFAGSGILDVTNIDASSDNFGVQYPSFGSYDGDQGLTLKFMGSAVQQINSSVFGAVTIDNSNGVNLEGNTDIHGDLTITNGTFYVDDNIIVNLWEGLSIGSGSLSFSSNGSYLLVFDDGGASSITLPGGLTMGYLYLNRAAGMSLAGDLTVNNSFHLITGALSIAGHTLTLNGDINYTGGSVTGSSSSNLTVGDAGGAGTLDLNGFSTLGTLTVDRDNGMNLDADLTVTSIVMNRGDINLNGNNLTYSGASSLSFTSTTGSQTTNDVLWPGSNGPETVTISNPDGVTLHNDRTTTHLVFTTGKLKLDDHNLTIGSGGGITGYSTSNYIYTNSTGRLWMTASTAGTIFPIGDDYNPITITPTSSDAVFSAGVADGIKDQSGNPITTHAVNEQWDVVMIVGSTQNVGIQVGWTAGEELSGFDRTASAIGYRTSNTTGAYTHGATSDGSSFTQTATILNMPTSTPYYLGVGDNLSPLPVTLINFNAAYQSSGIVDLNWATASEINNNYFNIERSIDGKTWQTIGKVEGHGNSLIECHYATVDNLVGVLPTGTLYYRLKQVDFNGAFNYSEIRTVEFAKKEISLDAYPNPIVNTLNIDWVAKSGEPAIIKIVNMFGTTMFSKNVTGESLNHATIDLSNYSSGNYILEYITATGVNSKMIIKN